MSERPELFRSEALEHRRAPVAPGSLVRLGSRWTRWPFWTLLVLAAVALFATTQIRLDSSITGTALASPSGKVVVLVPATLAGRIEPGDRVRLGAGATRVTSVAGPLAVEDTLERYGTVVYEPSIALETSAAMPARLGAAQVQTGSRPLIALVPGLSALFGDE